MDTQDDQTRENPAMVVVEGSVSSSTGLRVRDDGLNEHQRAFIDFYCAGVPGELIGREEDAPPGDGYASALAAGYAESGAKNMATRNLLKPKIQDEIERRVKMGRGTMLLLAVNRGVRLMEESDDDRAVGSVLLGFMDRFGLAPPKGPAVAVQVNQIGSQQVTNILLEVAERRQQRLTGPSSGPEAA